jgi:hypothetical protein
MGWTEKRGIVMTEDFVHYFMHARRPPRTQIG